MVMLKMDASITFFDKWNNSWMLPYYGNDIKKKEDVGAFGFFGIGW